MAVDKELDEVDAELEAIFAAEAKKYTKQTYAEEAIDKAELEYKSMGSATETRVTEKEKLNAELKQLNTKLRSTKNVRNVRVASSNSSNMSSIRMTIKKRIEAIKDRLYDIEIEEKGGDGAVVAEGMKEARK